MITTRVSVIVICLMMLMSGVGRCQTLQSYNTQDIVLESAWIAIDAMDWLQTRNIARNPDQYYETNFILGHHPSVRQVNTYFALGMLGHVITTSILKRPYRNYFQMLSIGISATYVNNNCGLGIKMNW